MRNVNETETKRAAAVLGHVTTTREWRTDRVIQLRCVACRAVALHHHDLHVSTGQLLERTCRTHKED